MLKMSLQIRILFIQFFILSLYIISSAQTWYSIEPRATDKSLTAIYFCDSLNGWAVGDDGAIVHSTDGGFKWALQTSGTVDTLLDVYFLDTSNGWAVGRNGCVLHTIDGGTTWIKLLKRTDYDLIKVCSNGDTVVIISYYKLIFKSTDGGNIWTNINIGSSIGFYHATFLSVKNILMVTSSGLLKSTDAGDSWQNYGFNNIPNTTEELYIYPLNMDTCWTYNYGALYVTSNGGLKWDSLSNPELINSWMWFAYAGFDFIDSKNGYLATDDDSSSLWKTVNGGLTWSRDTSFAPTTDRLRVFYLDKWHNGWRVGDFGAIYTNKTRNNSGIKRNIINSDLIAPQKIQTNKSYAMVPLLKNTNRILICNCIGKFMASLDVSHKYYDKGTFPVNVEKLSPGLYFLALKSDETIQKTYKLIKR